LKWFKTKARFLEETGLFHPEVLKAGRSHALLFSILQRII